MNKLLIKAVDIKVLDVSKELSFEINRGDLVVLYGLNGSGKTLLLKSMLGIFPYKYGKLDLNFDISNRGVCLQFPEYLIFAESVIEEAEYITGCKDRAIELIQKIGVTANQLPLFMSEGEKRLLFLLGLMESKDILFFDEPFSSLDKYTKKVVRNKIVETQSLNKTIIYTANRFNDIIDGATVINVQSK